MELKARMTVLVGVAFLLVVVAAALPLQEMSGMMEAIALFDERAAALATVGATTARIQAEAWRCELLIRQGAPPSQAAGHWERVVAEAEQAGNLAGIRISPLLRSGAVDVVAEAEAGLLDGEGWRRRVSEGIAPELSAELGRVAIGLRSANLRKLDQIVANFSRARLVVPSVTLVALAMALIVVSGVGRWLLRPIRELASASEAWSRGRLEVRAPVRRPDELGRLAEAMNRMAERLAHLQVRLAEAQRMAALGEMTAAVSHNIRNPLSGIRSAAQLLGRRLSGEEKTLATGIVGSVDHLERWMRNLLQLDPAEGASLAVAPAAVGELARRAVEAISPLAAGRGARIEVKDESCGGALECDGAMVAQALVALLTNAAEASPEGGRVRVRISARDYLGRPGWVVEIRDDGEGVGDELVSKVLDPFYSTKATGLGLGLPGAMRIARRHGGTIEIEPASRAGGGLVRLRLPSGGPGDLEEDRNA